VLVEYFSEKEDEMWLGKVVATEELGSTAVPKCKEQHGGRQHFKGTRYDKVD